jgi:hypothetical protein
VSEHLKKLAPAVRTTVLAARRLVKEVAPKAEEISYRMEPPRSVSMMWKIARYAVGGENVVGIGTFTKHSALFFYRGRELDDGSGLLQGSGKDSRFITLRSPADVDRPAVKRLVRKAFSLEVTPAELHGPREARSHDGLSAEVRSSRLRRRLDVPRAPRPSSRQDQTRPSDRSPSPTTSR